MRPTFLAVLALAAVACRPAPPPLTDADKAAIRVVSDSFVAHARAGNDSALAALYTETGVLLPDNAPVAEGRAAILAFFQSLPALPDFEASVIDVDGRGDLAYVRGTYAYTVAPAAGRTPAVTDRGKFLEIRRRQTDGTWLMAIDIFNSDLPLATR